VLTPRGADNPADLRSGCRTCASKNEVRQRFQYGAFARCRHRRQYVTRPVPYSALRDSGILGYNGIGARAGNLMTSTSRQWFCRRIRAFSKGSGNADSQRND